MKVIITGSTGMIGKGVLLECLEDPDISAVLVINRRKLGLTHQKLRELIVSDFFAVDQYTGSLRGYDVCLFCLGTTAVGKSEEIYHRITYELTTLFAQAMLTQNPGSSFCYVSGAGTDSTGQGKVMWARIKGKTENKLLSMHFDKVHAFRPGFIQPLKGIRSATEWYNIVYALFGFLYPLLKRLPKYVTDTTTMAKAMIRVAQSGYKKPILESIDINAVGRGENQAERAKLSN